MLARSFPLVGWVGPGPLPGRVFRGGCSRVERRLVGRLLALSCQYSSCRGGFAFGWACLRGGGGTRGVWGRPGTLLGPEGTGAPRVGVCFFCGPLPRSNR